jgi:hypothetical protein
MIYAAFALWLLLVLLTGMGLYRLWAKLLGGATTDWLMLPATLLGEIAYSAGRLMTGRPAYGGLISPRDASTDPCRSPLTGKHGLLVAMLASALTILSCSSAVLLLTRYLGGEVVRSMVLADGLHSLTALPKELPRDWAELWATLAGQLDLLRRLLEGWANVDWANWKVPLYVLLTAMLAVRLGPVRHDARGTLAVWAILAGLLAALAAAFKPIRDALTGDIWYVLTYLWAMLLLLLAGTLLAAGALTLLRLVVPAKE